MNFQDRRYPPIAFRVTTPHPQAHQYPNRSGYSVEIQTLSGVGTSTVGALGFLFSSLEQRNDAACECEAEARTETEQEAANYFGEPIHVASDMQEYSRLRRILSPMNSTLVPAMVLLIPNETISLPSRRYRISDTYVG